MLEILEFIFGDFWTFCAIVILLYVLLNGVTSSISYIFNKNPNNKENKTDETN